MSANAQSGDGGAIAAAEVALAEMCWCGHDYWHHTDSDTPACYWPLCPDGDDDFWEHTADAICQCDGWWPMNEDPPDDYPQSGRLS